MVAAARRQPQPERRAQAAPPQRRHLARPRPAAAGGARDCGPRLVQRRARRGQPLTALRLAWPPEAAEVSARGSVESIEASPVEAVARGARSSTCASPARTSSAPRSRCRRCGRRSCGCTSTPGTAAAAVGRLGRAPAAAAGGRAHAGHGGGARRGERREVRVRSRRSRAARPAQPRAAGAELGGRGRVPRPRRRRPGLAQRGAWPAVPAAAGGGAGPQQRAGRRRAGRGALLEGAHRQRRRQSWPRPADIRGRLARRRAGVRGARPGAVSAAVRRCHGDAAGRGADALLAPGGGGAIPALEPQPVAVGAPVVFGGTERLVPPVPAPDWKRWLCGPCSCSASRRSARWPSTRAERWPRVCRPVAPRSVGGLRPTGLAFGIRRLIRRRRRRGRVGEQPRQTKL